MRTRDELLQAAATLRSNPTMLGGWSGLQVSLAEWLEVTAGRVGGHTWTGSAQALAFARLINGAAA